MGDGPSNDATNSAAVLYQVLGSKLWGLSRTEELEHCVSYAPRELFEPCAPETFLVEYRAFAAWIRQMRNEPWAGELFKLTHITLQPCTKHGEVLGPQVYLSAPDTSPRGCFGRSADQVRCNPCPGLVVAFRDGWARVVACSQEPDMCRIYQTVMSTPLSQVRSRGVWHAVRLFHRVVHMSISSEALAEHAGSVLRFAERRARETHVGRLVGAARLRMSGLGGLGNEAAVWAAALNLHFRCDSPQGWHFTLRKKRVRGPRARLVDGATASHESIRAAARAEKLPLWAHTLLRDCHAHHFCKPLPVLCGFAVPTSKTGPKSTRHYSKMRRAGQHAAMQQYTPALLDKSILSRAGIQL